jgi:hypothetical protein
MQRLISEIPSYRPREAASIANAAEEAESRLDPGSDPSGFDQDLNEPNMPGRISPHGFDGEEEIQEVGRSLFDEDELPNGASVGGATAGVADEGIEFLAFYKSFRHVRSRPALSRWGIFFIKPRCVSLAHDMAQETGEPYRACLDVLISFLYIHELYHYRLDAHCLQLEASGGLPIYRPYRRHTAGLPINDWHEESIANYYALSHLRRERYPQVPRSICDFLEDMVACSPGAYAGGVLKKQDRQVDLVARQAMSAFKLRGGVDWQGLMDSNIRLGLRLTTPDERRLGPLLHLRNCPVYWIDWVRSGASVITPKHAVQINEIKGDFISKYLGGVLAQRTDHEFYRIDNGEMVKIPNPHRKDLVDHEFKNIILKAGMTTMGYYRERQRTSVWTKHVPRDVALPSRLRTGPGVPD